MEFIFSVVADRVLDLLLSQYWQLTDVLAIAEQGLKVPLLFLLFFPATPRE